MHVFPALHLQVIQVIHDEADGRSIKFPFFRVPASLDAVSIQAIWDDHAAVRCITSHDANWGECSKNSSRIDDPRTTPIR